MHTVDWRTKRGTSCRARCANPDCRARQTNYVKKKYVQGSIVTIQLLGAAVARRFAREGLTVAVARYLGAHTSYLCFVWCALCLWHWDGVFVTFCVWDGVTGIIFSLFIFSE